MLWDKAEHYKKKIKVGEKTGELLVSSKLWKIKPWDVRTRILWNDNMDCDVR